MHYKFINFEPKKEEETTIERLLVRICYIEGRKKKDWRESKMGAKLIYHLTFAASKKKRQEKAKRYFCADST
jgi:hypothetical protein